MTFANLLNRLKSFDANMALVFETNGQPIGAGYHVTELRHSTSTGIDCGGQIETWQEARLQLLDGSGDAHMEVGKFRSILRNSLSKLPQLADVPLLVEFSPENKGLKLMSLGNPTPKDSWLSISLGDSSAVCKPAKRLSPRTAKTDTCCQEAPAAGSNTGSDAITATANACCS